MSVHYVIAAYLGPRRIECPIQSRDRLHFLRVHLAQLETLEHGIDRISVVIAVDNPVPGGIRNPSRIARDSFAEFVPPSIRGTPVNLLWRTNSVGLSYASLVAAATDDFDYTIFAEDDYIFTVDHFDTMLVNWMERTLNTAMVCGAALPHPEMPVHAAMSCGIMRSKHLKGLTIAEYPQLALSREILKHGQIRDWHQTYATAFRTDANTLRWIGHADQAFVVPIQLLGRDVTARGHRII